jgi:hypothetical protein
MVTVKVYTAMDRHARPLDDAVGGHHALHGRPVCIRIQDNGTTHSMHLSMRDARELWESLRMELPKE